MESVLPPSKTSSNMDPESKKPRAKKTRITVLVKPEPLTTKKAVELLIGGNIQEKVCRFCLNVTLALNDLDQIMKIGGQNALYNVSIQDMVVTFHPVKIADDPYFPNKICDKCLNKCIKSYLFAQQCERSERALKNCFEDIHNKIEKLDPIQTSRKRGKQKRNPNHNKLYTQHRNVIDYAEPLYQLRNLSAVSYSKELMMTDLECTRCFQVFPNAESLTCHEKTHQKTMWYNCRLCGKSFPKKMQFKKHLRIHQKALVASLTEKSFECKECGHICEDYQIHLQHIEKHKFKKLLEHLVDNKMDKLCNVCLETRPKMTNMDKTICLHGGYPELTGERSVYNILGACAPEMNIMKNFTGKKICLQCLDHAIIAYIFMNKLRYIRHRLNVCITSMLDSFKNFQQNEGKLFIEIAENAVMPIQELFDDNLLLNDDEIDENQLKVQVLEDEFRLKSDSESEDDSKSPKVDKVEKDSHKTNKTIKKGNTQDKVIKQETLVNGYEKPKPENDISNKINNKTKRLIHFTCPLCDKHFISDYFLTKHILKHRTKIVNCKTCSKQFKSKFHLREHFKMVHLLNKKLFSSCTTCDRAFSNDTKRSVHEKRHLFIQCDLCDTVFNSQFNLNNHLQRHISRFITKRIRKQTCSFCEQEFATDTDLTTHVNKIHLKIKPHSCDMCEKKFYTQNDLRSHKKIHSLPSKEKCEFCSKIFKSRISLVVHIRKHIGIKPHQCILCTQTFYSKGLVIKHMNTWHGGRFCCKLCKKVFINKAGLKNHVNTSHLFF